MTEKILCTTRYDVIMANLGLIEWFLYIYDGAVILKLN